MTRLHAGAVLERPPGPKYRKALDFAELRPVGPPPKAATLRRWREESGGDLIYSLVLPKAATHGPRGPFRLDEDGERALAWALEAAEALEARFVVVESGGDFTTGQRDRELFERWVGRWPETDRAKLVWHPGGLWDPELAIPFARALGVVWAFDPLVSEPASSFAYARLRALGMRQRFSETILRDVLDGLAEVEEAYVSIESAKSFTEAQRLAAIAAAEME